MIARWTARLFDIPGSDPEDTRKLRLLAIMTFCIFATGLLLGLAVWTENLFDPSHEPAAQAFLYGSLLAVLGITGGIYLLNRFVSGTLARALFMAMWVAVLPFTDVPEQVAGGRSLFPFVIPIVISSVLLRPVYAFLFAFTGSLTVALMGVIFDVTPNAPAIAGFFIIALVSWMSARSLENARNELMHLNQDLDRRVTDRTVQLSEALDRERAEAGKNQAILEGITDGVVVFDQQGRAILANPALERLTGIPARDCQGRQLADLLGSSNLAEKDRKALHVYVQRPASTSSTMQVTCGEMTLVISMDPVITASGEQIGRVMVFHNYTQQAEVDRVKNDFVAMVSYELRTPLNSILGYADMLREGVYGKLGNQQAAVVGRVTSNTRRLLTLVSDLLDQAQIDAGRLVLHERFFRPAELIDYVNSAVEGMIESKGLNLSVRVAEDLPANLYGDPQRLGQVLVNLVNNAVKFTQKGMIAVRIFRLDAEHWAVDVSDTGIGIPPDAQMSIFDIYHRDHFSTEHKSGGVGLGLSIVKRLVELMEGELCLNSQVGKGSTFTVILPFERAVAPVADAGRAENRLALPSEDTRAND